MAFHVVVLVTGIADPRGPLPAWDVAASGSAVRVAPPVMLGSFDEAALELGLKLRDADPATRVTVFVVDAAGSEALARTAAAHRPDDVLRMDASAIRMWDAGHAAAVCAEAIRAMANVDLVLIGREFGDCDDGALPPCLAERLGWPFAGLVQDVTRTNGRLETLRERGGAREWTEVAPPGVVSVTNDRCNRLRYPLLKNVIAAKRATFASMPVPDVTTRWVMDLAAASPAPAPQRASACRMLVGPLEGQVDALSDLLLEATSDA